ncbi:MAG: hypothetical protein ABI556_11175 [Gemmatimonadales bacterium]
MSKAKTNALDALRALIAERQQYEQWMTALEAKRAGTPEQVFERVQADYRGRLDRVVGDIRGHAEELQLSISTLSSRLVEVARDEDTRREGLEEAKLRADVGEYEPKLWEQLKSEAEQGLAKAAGDRESLDGQLGELRAIQKLSEVGSVGSFPAASEPLASVETPAAKESSAVVSAPAPAEQSRPVQQESSSQRPFVQTPAPPAAAPQQAPAFSQAPPSSQPPAVPQASDRPASDGSQAEETTPNPAETPRPEAERMPVEPIAAAASAMSATQRPRTGKTPPSGGAAVRRTEAVKPDQAKTLKCPECGTPNYPTEWYCERCGGELATM